MESAGKGAITDEEIAPLRAELPITERHLYLDNAAVAPLPRRSLDAMTAWARSVHERGGLDEDAWEAMAATTRASAARVLGCSSPERVAFVRNTSHGLSLAAAGLRWRTGDAIAYFAGDYPSNVYPWEVVARRHGVQTRPVRHEAGGRATADALAPALEDGRVRLVAVSSAFYATGARADLDAIGALCRERDALLVVDGIQTLGFEPGRLDERGIDVLAADGHKWLLSVPGCGVTGFSERAIERIDPVIVGWKSARDAFDFDRVRDGADVAPDGLAPGALRFEEGSPDYAGIACLGASIDLLLDLGLDRVTERVRRLAERLAEGAGAAGLVLRSPADPNARAGFLSIAHPDGDAATATVHARLTEGSVVASLRRGSLRLAPHVYTTEAEIDRAVALLAAP